MSAFIPWRQPLTIQEINTDIDQRWPVLINFNLRQQLEDMAAGNSMYWTQFAPKLQITDMCLKAGLIEWVPAQHGVRHLRITDAGRQALEQTS